MIYYHTIKNSIGIPFPTELRNLFIVWNLISCLGIGKSRCTNWTNNINSMLLEKYSFTVHKLFQEPNSILLSIKIQNFNLQKPQFFIHRVTQLFIHLRCASPLYSNHWVPHPTVNHRKRVNFNIQIIFRFFISTWNRTRNLEPGYRRFYCHFLSTVSFIVNSMG